MIRALLATTLFRIGTGPAEEPKLPTPEVWVLPDLPQARLPQILSRPETPVDHPTLDRLAHETWTGVRERMVSPTGLPYDRMRIDAAGRAHYSDRATSPTNIGLYLAALVTEGAPRRELVKTIASLEKLRRDDLGFFYNWYDADELKPLRLPAYISSVDNGNLMVVLEGLLHALRNDRSLSRRIEAIAGPMRKNFAAAFLETDPSRGEKQGTLQLGRGQNTHYDRLGSEARSIVALMEAEGHLPEGSLARMRTSYAEKDGARVFKTWDGGMFQYLLPNVLLGEGELSSSFAANHTALLRFLERDDGLIAGHSASDLPEGGYSGKHGVKALSEEDPALISERVITPHAIFLTASVSKPFADRALARLTSTFPQIHREGVGLFDAIDPATGRCSDTILSLDQLMSVLATRDFGKHVRARARSLAELHPRARTLEAVYASVPL